MFKIGDEDFSFGDDEEFWSEALEVEAATTTANSSKPATNSTISSGSLATQHPQISQEGSLVSENVLQPRSSCLSTQVLGRHAADFGSALGCPREVGTLQDANRGPPTTPENQAKRKFSFKQKSQRGSPSIPSTEASKRARQDNQRLASDNNFHLQVTSDNPVALQDLSKNIQIQATCTANVANLRAPTNYISGPVKLMQPLTNPNNKAERKEQQENKTEVAPRFLRQRSNGNLLDKTKGSLFKSSPATERGQTPSLRAEPPDSVAGQEPCTTTSNPMEGLLFEFEDNLDELSEDFDWDPVVTPSSAIATASNPKSVSTLRSSNLLNPLAEAQRTSCSFQNCNISTPISATVGSMPGSSMPKLNTKSRSSNPQVGFNQQRPSALHGDTPRSTGFQINSSGIPPSGPVSTSCKSTPRFSSSNPAHNRPPNLAQNQSQPFQGNPTRMNFQPRTPSTRYPNHGPVTQHPPRSNTPLRASTPGYTSPSPNFQARGAPQGPVPTLQTPNIRTNHSTPRQFATHVQHFNNSTSQNRYNSPQGDKPFTTHGAKPQNRVTATPQTPLLTSRVAQLFQTPTASSTGPSRTRVRKFPGPAGVLPKLAQGQKINDIKLPSPENDLDKPGTSFSKPEELDSSLGIGDTEFSDGAWQIMKTDLGLEDDDPHSILAKNNIALVLRKASLKQLAKNKVPHLCVLIKAVTFNADASVVLRDPTGEMQGTMHRRLVEEHQSELKPGSVLVLRQVGVLSPSLRNHYLNITPSNLIQIYPSESSTSAQSSQRTPKSRTLRPSQRPSKGASPQEADQNMPKRSRGSEAKRRHSSGGVGHDALEEAPAVESALRTPKRHQSSELKQRSGDSRISVENAHTNVDHGMLDVETAFAGVNHNLLNKSTTALEKGTTCPGVGHRDSKQTCPQKEMAVEDPTSPLGGLKTNKAVSDTAGIGKGEDFSELLADIGDDFFDEF